MADLFVASGGSNTSPYETWAKAATSLQTALTAATGTGDRVIIQYNAVPSGDAEVGLDTTYTFAGNITLISASNDGGSAFTPTAMGTAYWIGNSTTNRSMVFAGAFICTIWGITVRVSGSTADSLGLVGNSDSASYTYDSCYFWLANTSASARIYGGGSGASYTTRVISRNCTFRFANASQGLLKYTCLWEIEGGSISSAGTAPTTLVYFSDTAGQMIWTGVDLSHVTGTLIGNQQGGSGYATFVGCKLGSGVTILATQTVKHTGSMAVTMYDCASGDAHYAFAHYTPLGSLVASDTIYATDAPTYDGTNKFSWRIDTSADATFANPFVTPWISIYHSGTSAITLSLEGLISSSTDADAATQLQNDEVWGEFSYKGTSGYTLATLVDDRMALSGTAADQTSTKGASDWTGEQTNFSTFKCATTSTITPAEIGELRARLYVAFDTSTRGSIYLDPQVRTA